VTAQPLPDGRAEVHFAVRDTGIGIPRDRMDRLFKSFSQVDSSVTRTHGGTGLGLAICKRLSELMGGRIWVESEPGKGSTFHFTILAQPTQAPPRPKPRHSESGLLGLRVLIVDDNATNRRILGAQARSWGMLPREAATPGEALDWVRRGDPFEVALLDYQMPDMDGIALAQELRRLRPAPALPLVLLSSIGRRAESMNASPGLFAACLTKPVKQSQLFDTLAEALHIPSDEPAPAAGATGAAARAATVRPIRILLVEDNAVNQKVALRILQKLGHSADVAGNGLEAINALERQPYDLVFMDVQMPEMDGLEAARIIRQRFQARPVRPRIVAMTAHALKGDRERCLEAGMDDYISKPVEAAHIAEALVRAAGQQAPQPPRDRGA